MPRRSERTNGNAKAKIAAVVGLCSLTLWGAPRASAQSLYVTSDKTIGGGNPINGSFSLVQVGADAAFNPFPNVVADITGGSVSQYVNALNGSTVNIRGGTIGTAPSGGTYSTAVNIALGGTVNLSAGTVLSFVDVRDIGTGAVNTFNMTGGALNAFLINENGGVVSISGGSVDDYVANYGAGTVNVTGGSLTSLASYDFYGPGGTINFGGTATVNSITSAAGVANISGGTIGAAGVTVRGSGVANFTGAGLTVNPVGPAAPYFDPDNYVNLIVSQYTVTGTLTSGAAVNTTVSAGENFANNGFLATFNAPALAPDLYVATDQTVTGVYNNVNVGIDADFNPSNPTATIAAGTDTVFLTTFGNSVTNMTGGTVRGFVYVAEQSQFTMSGGEAPGGIDSDPGTTIHVSGGSTSYLGVGGTATVSGGAIDFIDLHAGSTLIVQGTGLATAGTAGHYWDPNTGTNYLLAGNFEVTGTLADGTPFDQTVIASGASGTASQQTIAGPQAAPNLYATADVTTNTIYNQVNIGTDADGTVNTSPAVTFGPGTDVGTVVLRNQSTLSVKDGVVNGSVYESGDASLNISGGTVATVYQTSPGTGKITVSGGSTTYIAPFNQMFVTGGHLGTLDTYAGAQVRVEGGDVTRMLLFGGTPKTTNVVITGGAVGTIDFRTSGVDVIILGGSVGEIWGAGGTVEIYGGIIGADTLLNYRANATLYDIFGDGLTLTDASLGSYTDGGGTTYDGAWWTVSGTLDSGDPLNTRYFERNGTLAGPANLVFNVVVPEPGSVSAIAGIGALALVRRRRNNV